MSNANYETEHFFIEHAHWNEGTKWPTYSIQPKDNTKDSTAALPTLAKSYGSADALVPDLNEAEAWYVANRARVEKYRTKKAA